MYEGSSRRIPPLSLATVGECRAPNCWSFNNLAYFLSIERGAETYDVPKARWALDQLKKYVGKDEWSPDNPEYFQTEAEVELEEFHYGQAHGNRIEYLTMKLANARREIEIAIRLNPAKSQYLELREEIEDARAKLVGPNEQSIPTS